MPTLQFKGKNIIWNHHLSVPYHTLEEVSKLHFQPDKSNGNLIIEGDNLLALKALLPMYAGKVKVVCIDPPYNTGNEGWVYNDSVNSPLIKDWLGKEVGKDDLTRHDKWLCMMTPRLRLLRELLADDGVILSSCDDNELYNLRALLDEVFLENNWVGTIVWRNVTDNNPTNIALEHEYIVCFSKNKERLDNVWKSKMSDAKNALIKIGQELNRQHKERVELEKAYKEWFRENKKYLGQLDRYKYIDAGGVYTGSQSVHNPGKEGYRYDVLHPVTKKPCKQPLMGYRFPESTMKELLDKKKILFGEDENKIIELKVYAEEFVDKLPSVVQLDGRLGSYDLKEIFPDAIKVFDNPKPIQLLTQVMSYMTKKNDLILDSFSGSGTTGHAVMDLNMEDGGSRKFILVQMAEATEKEPDKNICKDITRERIRRAIEKYGYDSGFQYQRVGQALDAETLLEGNLPAYKTFAKYVYYLCTGENLRISRDPSLPKRGKKIPPLKKGDEGGFSDKNISAESQISEKKFFVGAFGKQAIYLIYKQDYEALTKMALNLELAEKIIADQPDKKRIVYAPACFLDEEYMEEKQIEFVSIPYNLFQKKGG